MAEDKQVSILQAVVAELRQLNKSSKVDMMREKEAQLRAEKLAESSLKVEDQGAEAISNSQDFSRRFLAGQAKELLNKGKLTPPKEGDKPVTRDQWKQQHVLQIALLKNVENIYAIFEKKKGDEAENAREKDKDKKDKAKVSKSGGGSLAKAAKGAAGMAAVGLGLGGFMSGLMVWSGYEGFQGANFPTQAKNLKDGFNHIGGMDNKALIVMGSMVAAGGLFGATLGVGKSIKGAVGMSAVGLGLGGFMSGLMVFSEVEQFTGSNFPVQAENLVKGFNHIGGMKKESIAALTAIIGIGAVGGAVSVGKTTLAAGGMALAGLGLGGFMAGLAAPGDLSGFKGTEFATQSKNLTEGFNHLGSMSAGSITALTSLAALGAVGGAVSIGKTAFAAGGMALAGLGLGGFMAGIAAAGDLTGFDGSNFAKQAKNLAAGLGAFSGPQSVALAAMITAGAVLGPMGSVVAAAGMTALGAGIGGFFTAMAGIGDLGALVGVDGSGLKSMLTNMASGLSVFNTIEGDNLGSVGTGLIALAGGLTALFAIKGATGVADTVGDALDGVKNAFNWEWLSGVADKETGASGMDNLIDGIIGPMAKLAKLGEMSTDLDLAKKGISSVVGVLNSLSGLKLNRTDFAFGDIVDDFVRGAHGIDVAFNGGNYSIPGMGNDLKIVNGIRDISALEYNTASNGIAALQHALNGWDGNPTKSNQFGQPPAVINNIGGSTTTFIQQPEVVRMKPGGFAGYGARNY